WANGTLGGRGRPAGGSHREGEEDHSERTPGHADAPVEGPSPRPRQSHTCGSQPTVLPPPPTPVVSGLARSREFQHSHGYQARAWGPPVWDFPRQDAKRPPRCPPQGRAQGPRGRRMASADRLRGGQRLIEEQPTATPSVRDPAFPDGSVESVAEHRRSRPDPGKI